MVLHVWNYHFQNQIANIIEKFTWTFSNVPNTCYHARKKMYNLVISFL